MQLFSNLKRLWKNAFTKSILSVSLTMQWIWMIVEHETAIQKRNVHKPFVFCWMNKNRGMLVILIREYRSSQIAVFVTDDVILIQKRLECITEQRKHAAMIDSRNIEFQRRQ